MALQEVNNEAILPTVQAMLAFFDREDVSIPGNMAESIVSGKSLLRAFVTGQLVVAQRQAEPPAKEPEEASKGKKKAA